MKSEYIESQDKADRPDLSEATGADALCVLGQYESALRLIDRSLAGRLDAGLLNRRGLILEALGRRAEAKQAYQRAMLLEPSDPDGFLNLAALIHREHGQFKKAVLLCRQAISLAPPSSKGWVLLGCIYQSRSMWDMAEQCQRKALLLEPGLTEAHQNLGLICAARNRHDQAVEHFKQALASKPRCSRTWNDLGISLRALGRLKEASNAYDEALRLDPRLHIAWYHKGNVLQDLGRLEQAAEAYSRALKLKPDNAGYWNNLGVVLRAMNQNKRAVWAYRKAIAYAPQTAELYNNLGLALETLQQSEAAIDCYRKAIRLKPDFAEAWRNMAGSYKEMCRPELAVEYYRKALELRPDYYCVWWNLSLALLQGGQLREGFSLYLYRNQPELKIFTYPHNLPALRWDGSSFIGKTLLIYCEQGFGDSIQFVRYLPLVRHLGGHTILEASPALVRLFEQSSLSDQVIAAGDLPPAVHYDLCASILDLPAIFKTSLETLPSSTAYLRARTRDADLWNQLLDKRSFSVGIVWAGNPGHAKDKNRSCPCDFFFELSRAFPQMRFYSLQTMPAEADAAKLTAHPQIIDLQHSLGDFADTAAVMQALDLIVTVDTSVAHLAGALGRPVWTLLPYCPDWRWLLNRNDSPWYPTMRLFRQGKPGDWPGVFKTLQSELAAACRRKETGQAI